jgi:acetyl/propionyl-CoA carboxylase alpha subunit
MVMCCICLKENVVFNAAIKSSEEAPSSVLSPQIRQNNGSRISRKSCDYLIAGTVGFLLDENNNFIFSK